jgi:hypothetical protein
MWVDTEVLRQVQHHVLSYTWLREGLRLRHTTCDAAWLALLRAT